MAAPTRLPARAACNHRCPHTRLPAAPCTLQHLQKHTPASSSSSTSRGRARLVAAAASASSPQGDTLKSLDSILGSRDELPQQEEPQQQAAPVGDPAVVQQQQQLMPWQQPLEVPGWAWGAIQEPRVVPLTSNALYYLTLLVFVSYYAAQLADGPEAGDDLIARLTNDHAAVAAGDTLRLFTSAFVADRLPALIVGLVALATLAGELESLLGYSTFWAVYCLVVISGALADAGLSSVPITSGPAAGVAGLAAALLAHHARNWRIEQLLQQARVGDVPRELRDLENAYLSGATSSSSSSGSSGSSSGSGGAGQQQQQRLDAGQGAVQRGEKGSSSSSGSSSSGVPSELVETEIEAPLSFMEGLTVLLPREGKAFITLGGVTASVVSALRDAFATDGPADWTGLVAGFAAGLVLGWAVCPVYELTFSRMEGGGGGGGARRGGGSSGSGGSGAQQRQVAAPGPLGAGGGDGGPFLLPVLRDTRAPVARANAVLGYAAGLFAALGGWLVAQGVLLQG